MAKFIAKKYLVTCGDETHEVEQDTPLRAIEQALELYSVKSIVVDEKTVTVTEIQGGAENADGEVMQ